MDTTFPAALIAADDGQCNTGPAERCYRIMHPPTFTGGGRSYTDSAAATLRVRKPNDPEHLLRSLRCERWGGRHNFRCDGGRLPTVSGRIDR